jgi:hypothetical protein
MIGAPVISLRMTSLPMISLPMISLRPSQAVALKKASQGWSGGVDE